MLNRKINIKITLLVAVIWESLGYFFFDLSVADRITGGIGIAAFVFLILELLRKQGTGRVFFLIWFTGLIVVGFIAAFWFLATKAPEQIFKVIFTTILLGDLPFFAWIGSYKVIKIPNHRMPYSAIPYTREELRSFVKGRITVFASSLFVYLLLIFTAYLGYLGLQDLVPDIAVKVMVTAMVAVGIWQIIKVGGIRNHIACIGKFSANLYTLGEFH